MWYYFLLLTGSTRTSTTSLWFTSMGWFIHTYCTLLHVLIYHMTSIIVYPVRYIWELLFKIIETRILVRIPSRSYTIDARHPVFSISCHSSLFDVTLFSFLPLLHNPSYMVQFVFKAQIPFINHFWKASNTKQK